MGTEVSHEPTKTIFGHCPRHTQDDQSGKDQARRPDSFREGIGRTIESGAFDNPGSTSQPGIAWIDRNPPRGRHFPGRSPQSSAGGSSFDIHSAGYTIAEGCARNTKD